MKYIEISTEEAIEMLKNSKGCKVLVAVQDLENDTPAIFYQRFKGECERLITGAQTITSLNDDFVHRMDLFSEQQVDILNIRPKGVRRMILLRE